MSLPFVGRCSLLFAALLLGACATRPVHIERRDASELGQLQQWQAQGRIAVAASNNSGGSGTFLWQQQRDHSFVQVAGPAGVGHLQLSIDGDHVRIDTGERELQAQDALLELEQRLGAPVPAASLRYWLLGLPAPGEYRWIDERSEAPILEQAGWRIEYQSFVREGELRLPAKLKATGGETRLRVIVDRWQLGS